MYEGSKENDAAYDIFVDDQVVPETNFEDFEKNITSPPQVVSSQQPVFLFKIDNELPEEHEDLTPKMPTNLEPLII